MSLSTFRPSFRRPRRKSRYLSVVGAAVLLLGLAVPGTASADPTPTPTPPSGGEARSKLSVITTGKVAETARRKPFSQEELRKRALERAVRERQYSYVDAETVGADTATGPVHPLVAGDDLPTTPRAKDVSECLDSGSGDTPVGRVVNRGLYCARYTIGSVFWEVDPASGQPIKIKGLTKIDVEFLAYGSRQTRAARIFFRVVPDSAAYVWAVTDVREAQSQHFMVDVGCVAGEIGEDDRCILRGGPLTRTYKEWNDGVDWEYWTIESKKPTLDESTVDYMWGHEWHASFQNDYLRDKYKLLTPAFTPNRSLRCDSATYFANQGEACIFSDVVPHLNYSTKGPEAGVAKHIRKAQDTPNDTYPRKDGPKEIPGKFINGDVFPPALHRISKDDPRAKANTLAKDQACANRGPFAGRGLPPELQPKRLRDGVPADEVEDCDEYPFRSTREGAGQRDAAGNLTWNFSVQAVNYSQNRSAGGALPGYYNSDRILLEYDGFYVNITDDPPGGPPGPGGGVEVDAGPPVEGDEGRTVLLSGSSSEFDEGGLTWTVEPGEDVDPGTTCTFADPTAARTSISCTDDGTFVLTLTFDDDAQVPVSDSTLLTLHNVAPQVHEPAPQAVSVAATAGLGIVTPKPWQLFRVGDPVTLTTTFTDPGANDTHTCSAQWDDGQTESYPSTGYTCQRSHTYTHAGMYTIKPGIADDDAGIADPLSVMVVVYDPAAGVAHGNGWLDAPGSVGFNFTSSYPTKAFTVPNGGVSFSLPPRGDLNLRAHQHLEWLVVTPDGKIAIKGTAERIPGQNVGFVLYGYYGCPAGQTTGCQPGPHRLRMVVWDSTTYGAIPEGVPAMYDNRSGNSFDVDEANPQNINQGMIQIQHPPIG
jgi:hypothetical protein